MRRFWSPRNRFRSALNKRLMVGWEASDPEIANALIRCPQCHSSRIEYPQLTRKFLTPAIASASSP